MGDHPGMSRSERLLALLQLLRRHRTTVSGARIAEEMGVSLRTVYRDIAALQAQGARIDGAPGLGYLLRPGFLLPPLMFSAEELEALALGMRWVAGRGDTWLAAAARDVQAKIADVLPAELRHGMETSGLLVGPAGLLSGLPPSPGEDTHAAAIRMAIRREHRLQLSYRDRDGQASERIVWPFALGYFDRARVLVAWCELRHATRHFRTDRIGSAQDLGERYPASRHALMARWREEEGVKA